MIAFGGVVFLSCAGLENGKVIGSFLFSLGLLTVVARGYDLYLVEANYEEEEIHRRIKEKEIEGAYAYEKSVLHNHLSKEKCDAWIYANAGHTSEYIYLHQHRDRTGA